MLGVGTHYWADLDGYTTAHGGPNLRRLPIKRFCSLVWWFITRNAESEADIEKLREQVWLPPKGEEGQGVWSAEAETDSFHNLMTDLGVDE